MAQHRIGHITASTVSPLLTGKGDKLLAGGVTHCKKLALERSGIVHPDTILNAEFKGNSATEWGNENEADAIALYEQLTFSDVHSSQEVVTEGEWLSCTPDGLIGDDGIVEIKCPHSEYVFLDYLIDKYTLADQYNDQVQFQLMLTGRKWCDLMAYHPHFVEGRNAVTVRVVPDSEWVEKAESRIAQAEELITEIIKTITETS